MKIFINDVETTFNLEPMLSVDRLAQLRDLPLNGVAIAVNGKVISRPKWVVTHLKDGDRVSIISMAFGG